MPASGSNKGPQSGSRVWFLGVLELQRQLNQQELVNVLRAHNPKVVSSNLTPATNFLKIINGLLDSTASRFLWRSRFVRILSESFKLSESVRNLAPKFSDQIIKIVLLP